MEKVFQVLRTNTMVQAGLLVVLGLLLVLWPGVTIVTVLYLTAILLALSGALAVFSYFRVSEEAGRPAGVLVTGVVVLLCALVIALFPGVIAGFFSVVLGAILVLCGVVNAVRSYELRAYQDATWPFSFAVSALIAIGGIVVMVNPFASTSLLVFVLGVVMVVAGAEDLLVEWRARKALREGKPTAGGDR